MKPGWGTVSINDLTEVITKGTTPTSVGFQFVEEGLNFIKVESIADGGKFIPHKFAKIDEACHAALQRSQLAEGDILFSIAGALGRTALVTADILPANTNQALAVIRLQKRSDVDPAYVYHSLSSGILLEQIEKQRGGVAQQNLSLAQVKGFKIPLPPLEEQQRIVAILDEAFEGLDRARANTEANLQSARELFLSALDDAFTKDVAASSKANLADVVTDDCTLSYGIVQPGDEVEGGLPIVRPTDLGDRIIVKAGLKSINPKNADGYKRTELKGGDILLCVRGSTGVVSIADKELRGANVTRGIVPIRFNERVLNQYYGYFQIVSSLIQEQIKAGTYGAALMQINIRDLRKIEFIVPTMDRQSECVEIFEELESKTDTLILEYAQKLQDLDDLRQSLLQKAFAGELT